MAKAKILVQDIADALNLSRTTVSKVLNNSGSVSLQFLVCGGLKLPGGGDTGAEALFSGTGLDRAAGPLVLEDDHRYGGKGCEMDLLEDKGLFQTLCGDTGGYRPYFHLGPDPV